MRPRQSRHRLRALSGFTLLEITVVIVVVGIVLSMSAGRIHSFLLQQQTSRAATALQNDLEAAFAIATRNRRPVRIAWDANAMQLNVTNRGGTIFFRKTSLASPAYGLLPGAVAVSRSPIEVYPGGLADDTLAIVVSGTDDSKSVRMSRAGMIRVQ